MSVRFWFHLHQYHRWWRWWLQCTIFFRMAWKHTHFLFGWDLTRLPKADLHVSWLGNQSRPNPHWRWIPKMEPYGTSNVGLSFGFMTGLFPWQSVKQTYWTFEHDVFMFPQIARHQIAIPRDHRLARYAYQIFSGLAYLHYHKIVHRDMAAGWELIVPLCMLGGTTMPTSGKPRYFSGNPCKSMSSSCFLIP